MISKPLNHSITTVSVKVYQALLLVYPTKFRQEYGSEMLQVFQDCCLRAFRQSGANGIFRLWGLTLLDFLLSVLEQHMQKETYMSKSQFIKLSGWAFILGSFSFITILSGSDPLAFPGSIISSILLAVGMLGLRARFGERSGSLGRNMLLLGILGPILLLITITSMAIMYRSGNLTVTQVEKGLWILMFVGPAITLLGLTLFGLAALRSKPMPRFNWLPVVAGIWYPAFYIFLSGYLYTNSGKYPAQYQTGFNMLFLIQFIALCVLGFVLITDSPQEMTTA